MSSARTRCPPPPTGRPPVSLTTSGPSTLIRIVSAAVFTAALPAFRFRLSAFGQESAASGGGNPYASAEPQSRSIAFRETAGLVQYPNEHGELPSWT